MAESLWTLFLQLQHIPLQHPNQLVPVPCPSKYLPRTTTEAKQSTSFTLNLAQSPSGLLSVVKQLKLSPGKFEIICLKRGKLLTKKWTGTFFPLIWDVWLSTVILIGLLWSCWIYREQLSKLSLALKYFSSSYLGLARKKTVHRIVGTLWWPMGCLWICYFNYCSSLYQGAKHICLCPGEKIKLLQNSADHSYHYCRESGLELFCVYQQNNTGIPFPF